MRRRVKLTVFTKCKLTAAINAVIESYTVSALVLVEPHAGVAVFVRNGEMHTGVIFQEEVAGHGIAGFLDGIQGPIDGIR